ncbi:MAG: phosphoribosylamine--glycine ligase [Acidothermus sp.]|nr:phosphoribosylamine--glycine ligase [Acidothermus sp.]
MSKVLVVGGGGREDALCRALAADPSVTAIFSAPGNPGTARVGERLPVDPTDGLAVVELSRRLGVDLVVIGPEAPLVAGVADALRDAGLVCFGPSAAAARLEGSKAFAKEVMAAAGVPTARSRVCRTASEVAAALDEFGPPYVVKNDGLAAGKGVVVTRDRAAALDHAEKCERVVVEEFLDGPEASLFVVTDGTNLVPLLPAQDFKRVADGDQGPNTGGMGAYAPLDWVSKDLVCEILERIAIPTLAEMRGRGIPFTGLLYLGLAFTSAGPKVVEFNARFGDPETQAILGLLESPFGEVLTAAARGELAGTTLRWRAGAAVTVVLAAAGYPGTPRLGDPIEGVDAVPPPAYVLHAGTELRDGVLVSAGGRVLAVNAVADTLEAARAAAYAGIEKISLDGGHFRRDIALRAARGEIRVPGDTR